MQLTQAPLVAAPEYLPVPHASHSYLTFSVTVCWPGAQPMHPLVVASRFSPAGHEAHLSCCHSAFISVAWNAVLVDHSTQSWFLSQLVRAFLRVVPSMSPIYHLEESGREGRGRGFGSRWGGQAGVCNMQYAGLDHMDSAHVSSESSARLSTSAGCNTCKLVKQCMDARFRHVHQ